MTAKDSVTDKVKGLKLGADDYIVKPFESMELLARIEVVLRRTGKFSDIFDLFLLYPANSPLIWKVHLCHQ